MLEPIKAGIKMFKMLSATTVTKDRSGLLEPGNLMSTSIYPSMLSVQHTHKRQQDNH